MLFVGVWNARLCPGAGDAVSQFIFDMTRPKNESFVAKIIATNLPRATASGLWWYGNPHTTKVRDPA